MTGTGVWDSCRQFLNEAERQRQDSPTPPPQPHRQPQPSGQMPSRHAPPAPQEQWPRPLASPFAAPEVQAAAAEPSRSASGHAPMITLFGAAYLQEQAFSTGSQPSLTASLPAAETMPSPEGPLHQPCRSGASSPQPAQPQGPPSGAQEVQQVHDDAVAAQQLSRSSSPALPPPQRQAQRQQAQLQQAALLDQQHAQQQEAMLQEQRLQQTALLENQRQQQVQQAAAAGRLLSQQQQAAQHALLLEQQRQQQQAMLQEQRQQQAALLEQQRQQQEQQQAASLAQRLAMQQAMLEQQRSEQQRWYTAASQLIEQQAQQAQQPAQKGQGRPAWAAQQAQQAQQAQLPGCPACRQPVLPLAACVGPICLCRAGTGGRSAHMTDALCLSRASSSQGAGAGRAACHISQGSMAGGGCDREMAEMADEQQVQEVLSIARELGVLSDCPSVLEAQPSWVPASLGAPPPPLADRRSEESARSQLQLQQQQQQQMHAPLPPPRLTRGHSHPPSAHVQQQHALQAAPRGRRAEWAEGGNAAPDGMQRQPTRQLTADQLSELAHLLQRARAAGIQLPALQSSLGPAAQQQPQPQPQQAQPFAAAVQLQQQQLLSQQDEAGTGPMNVQGRSAMRVGLQRQISAEAQRAQQAAMQRQIAAERAQQAQQAQQAAMQRQISADSQAQHVAMHRQQLLLLEAAQAEQRKHLVHAQHAELLHLEQARQAQQAQQLLHAVDARRAAPAAQLPPPSGAQPWGQLAMQPAQQRGAFALPQLAQPQPPTQPAARPPPPPLQQGALSLYAQQQALLAQQRAEQQRWADAALRLLSQPPRAQQGTVSW